MVNTLLAHVSMFFCRCRPPPEEALRHSHFLQFRSSTDPSRLTAVYQSMVGQWFSTVAPYAYELFYALAALELAVFGWNLWMNYHGDIRAAIMTTANKILILGAFLSLLMNGQTWMADIINMFIDDRQASQRNTRAGAKHASPARLQDLRNAFVAGH